MSFESQLLGCVGARLAADTLTRLGYAILATRYRTAHGEIDLVCEHEGTLVFVEVKARATPEFGTAAECVTDREGREGARMGAGCLARGRGVGRGCRFGVVAIDDPLAGQV